MLRLLQLQGSSSGKPVLRVEMGPKLRRHNALSFLLLYTPSLHPVQSHSSKSSPYHYLL